MGSLEHYFPQEAWKDVDAIFTLFTSVVDGDFVLETLRDDSVEIKDPDSREVMALISKKEFEFSLKKFSEDNPITAKKISEIYKNALIGEKKNKFNV